MNTDTTKTYGGIIVFYLFVSFLMSLGSGTVLSAPENSPWGKDYFPNVALIDQNGKTVRFYDDLIKDKVVAINFIFTHCSDSCPLETASLKRVQKLLEDRMGKDIFFYSISIDPDQDTPSRLKEYAENFRTGSGWSFLTGNKPDITLLRKKLGLYRDGVEADKLSEHGTNFIVGNERTGLWVKRSPFDEPKKLARLLGNRLSRSKSANSLKHVSYSEAKQLPKMSKAEDIYRFRCLACHSLGKEDGLGPGLLDVTQKRDRSWLFRWLKAPNQLLADKDPAAIELYNRYQKIVMPNLRLSDQEIDELIDLLQANDESARHLVKSR